MAGKLSVDEIIDSLRESGDDRDQQIADLIDTLIEQRQDAINKREIDLAAQRLQTETMREMVGRSLEDVGPRRMVLDLLHDPDRRMDAVNHQLLLVARHYGDPQNWTGIPPTSQHTRRWLAASPLGPCANGWEMAKEVLDALALPPA